MRSGYVSGIGELQVIGINAFAWSSLAQSNRWSAHGFGIYNMSINPSGDNLNRSNAFPGQVCWLYGGSDLACCLYASRITLV